MAWHTFFGAYELPAHVPGTPPRSGDRPPVFHGASRSGAFPQIVRALLDLAAGHDALRFVAAQTATETLREPDGVTRQTRIAAGDVAAIAAAIDGLVAFCAREAERVAGLFDDFGGTTRADVEASLRGTGTGVDLNRDVEWGDDGDSPHFVFATLRSLRAAAFRIAEGDASAPARALIYWSWEPV